MDADDVRSLNKAYKTLNDNASNSRIGLLSDKRLVDADYKDLSFIRWSKSAINLHNNRIGRQVGRVEVFFLIYPSTLKLTEQSILYLLAT
jgi:hypothetical protein